MFSLPVMVKFCFKVNRDLVNKNQVTFRCIPSQLLFVPVLLGTDQSIPCPILQQWLQVTWRRLGFLGGCLYCGDKEGWFHGNSDWRGGNQQNLEFGSYTRRSPGMENRPALDDSGCFSNWYAIIRSSNLLESSKEGLPLDPQIWSVNSSNQSSMGGHHPAHQRKAIQMRLVTTASLKLEAPGMCAMCRWGWALQI